MDFIEFQSETYRSHFSDAIEDLLPSLKSANDEASSSALEMIVAMQRSIDVMARINSDISSSKEQALHEKDISQVGEYALALLDELSIVAGNRGLQQSMMLLYRLSIPVAIWVAGHKGKIDRLDIIVNAIASYANEIKDPDQLVVFSDAIQKIISAVTDEIKRDMEATNPMRPWRILNLNWGIVATRSHNVDIMTAVFDQLIENIPADAGQFFAEGMKQMEIIDYPKHVKVAMEKYHNMYKVNGRYH